MAEHAPPLTWSQLFYFIVAVVLASLLSFLYAAIKRARRTKIFDNKIVDFFMRAILFVAPFLLVGFLFEVPEIITPSILVALSYWIFDELKSTEITLSELLGDIEKIYKEMIIKRRVKDAPEREVENLKTYLDSIMDDIKRLYLVTYDRVKMSTRLERIDGEKLIITHNEEFSYIYYKKLLEKFRNMLDVDLEDEIAKDIVNNVKNIVEEYKTKVPGKMPYFIIYLSYEYSHISPYILPLFPQSFCTLLFTKDLETLEKDSIRMYMTAGETPVNAIYKREEKVNDDKKGKLVAKIFLYELPVGDRREVKIEADITYRQVLDVEDMIYYAIPAPAQSVTLKINATPSVRSQVEIWFSPILPYTPHPSIMKEAAQIKDNLNERGEATIHFQHKWVYPGNGFVLVTWKKILKDNDYIEMPP